jgi:uncharacterized protein
MAVVQGRTWLEHLAPPECWRLLSAEGIGRIGVIVDSAPEVYPVNYLVDDETILFRTDVGTKLRGLERTPSVCFQIDGIDLVDHTGWSVLVKGWAAVVSDPDELRVTAELPLRYWALGVKDRWVRVHPREVTGRRIHVTAAAADGPASQVEQRANT